MLTSMLRRAARATIKPLIGEKRWRKLRRRVRDRVRRRMTLSELATLYGSDKWGGHRYTPHYERHLSHLKHERFTLLEIGIGGYARRRAGGASLRMWRTWFPKAQIIGLDLENKSFVDGDRIRSYQGSQADPELLARIVREADGVRVVVDDGSHRPEHVRTTFDILFPKLDDGGIYAIEDTQTSYWPEYGGSEDRADPTTTMGLVKDLVDGLNHEEFVDESYQPNYTDLNVVAVHAYHNLVVIEKGRNVEGTNRRRLLRRRYAASSRATSPTAG